MSDGVVIATMGALLAMEAVRFGVHALRDAVHGD
jgi:hypothetical protein